jgi:hypothetical protein
MLRRIVLLIGRLFFDQKYMECLAAPYTVKAALGKVFLAANIGIPWPAHPNCRIQVGAGAVVTKSFPEGYQVIAGNPAKKISEL